MMTNTDYLEQAETAQFLLSELQEYVEARVALIKADEPLPPPTCGQCKHFYQGKVAAARTPAWGYCPLLDAERRISAKPCSLYREDCPF